MQHIPVPQLCYDLDLIMLKTLSCLDRQFVQSQ